MNFAPPVRWGDSIYSSLLHADPGKDIPHPRASVAELAALLRPEAPNLYSSGRAPAVTAHSKDPPWHFYNTQLIHYGLPITKDKNAAKVRLLNALNQFKLEVPAWILKMEGELKKEWDKENNKLGKAKTLAKSVTSVTSGTTLAGRSPIKSSGVNVTVNLSFNNNDVAYIVDSPTTKRKRTATTTPTSSASPSKHKQVQNDTTPHKQIKKELESTPSRPKIKFEPTPSRQIFIPTRIKPEPNTSAPRPILLSGLYNISCPTAEETFNTSNLDLTLSKDPSRNTFWARFRWGAWDGIMQMNPGSDADLTCSLGWRIRDLETRQLRFGEKCSGSIESTGDGMLRGCLVRVSGVEGGWVRQGGLSALNGGCLATMGWVGRALSPDICVRVRRLEV